MGQVSAASTTLINADPAATLAAVADYQKIRPKILSSQYSEYQVVQGGQGRAQSPSGSCRPPNRAFVTFRSALMSPVTLSSRRTPTRP